MPTLKIAGLLIVGLLLSTAPARSAPCLEIQSVRLSADPERNMAEGGRLARHILGAVPLPKAGQSVGMPMFADRRAWDAAWQALTGYPGQLLCDHELGSSQYGKTLSVQVPSMRCEEADGAGRCVRAQPFTSETVTYVFEVSGPPEAPAWILGTAYPKP
ncbi:hypothetical protein FHW79_004197 [Azospirillum sp. OGB3]|uniref:hypothetical protein n=1 Tax=Azospirillum sp. OGB3 TaxID=2587012 RepID=UPI001605A91C|nr:hypothetical protein [Azospirillum sp. OGB3]MBB3266556.1 hypothetical protein [Azospirillum sp. OGB3]